MCIKFKIDTLHAFIDIDWLNVDTKTDRWMDICTSPRAPNNISNEGQ